MFISPRNKDGQRDELGTAKDGSLIIMVYHNEKFAIMPEWYTH